MKVTHISDERNFQWETKISLSLKVYEFKFSLCLYIYHHPHTSHLSKRLWKKDMNLSFGVSFFLHNFWLTFFNGFSFSGLREKHCGQAVCGHAGIPCGTYHAVPGRDWQSLSSHYNHILYGILWECANICYLWLMFLKVIISWLNFRFDFQEVLNISYANPAGEHAWNETRTLAVHKLFFSWCRL